MGLVRRNGRNKERKKERKKREGNLRERPHEAESVSCYALVAVPACPSGKDLLTLRWNGTHPAVLAVCGNRPHNSGWLRTHQSWRNAKIKVEFVASALVVYCPKIWFVQHRLIRVSDGGWHWREHSPPVICMRIGVMAIFFPCLCTKPCKCWKKWS
jgi:hypothetical protein